MKSSAALHWIQSRAFRGKMLIMTGIWATGFRKAMAIQQRCRSILPSLNVILTDHLVIVDYQAANASTQLHIYWTRRQQCIDERSQTLLP